MARLIIVPQYPAKMRYQEWWFRSLPNLYKRHFDEAITIHGYDINMPELQLHTMQKASNDQFSPMGTSINWELMQIKRYMDLELKQDDILLLCDLSYPGLFANVLAHKRPDKAFAICHATSMNLHDYFAPIRHAKWPIEKGQALLFDAVFVATEYHKKKLNWPNVVVTGLPINAHWDISQVRPFADNTDRPIPIVSVARSGRQKRTESIENAVVEAGHKIEYTSDHNFKTWEEYYSFLRKCDRMLITSKEETFGYQVIDALINGVMPIAPNGMSYPELLPEGYLYDSVPELLNLLKRSVGQRPSIDYMKLAGVCRAFYINTARIMKAPKEDYHGTD